MTTLTRTVRNFTDVDFLFPKHPVSGNVGIKRDINAISQSVINLMTLKKGDKPFHPEIFSPLYTYMFENFSLFTVVILKEEIQKYVNYYEPRITISEVEIKTPSPNYLDVSMSGVIRGTTEPFNINILIDRLR